MADGIPGVAFDLSVKRESRAFIGSILEAEVSSRPDFSLKPQKKSEWLTCWRLEPDQNPSGRTDGPVFVVLQGFCDAGGRRRGEQPVLVGPGAQRRRLTRARVGVELRSDLIGQGGAGGQDGGAVEESRGEIPKEKPYRFSL